MSNYKNRISILLIITLIVGFILPLQAMAAGPNTNLTIHKVTGDTARPATESELTGTAPAGVTPISNISFTYWKVTADQLKEMRANPGKYTTASQVQAYVGASSTGTTGMTGTDGTVNVNGLVEGYYWFIENPSTAVQKSAAVPFGLDLPLSNAQGTGYITNLHVYPKNTLETTPTIDKDVVSDDNKTATFNIGDTFNWIIQPTTPKGLDEYSKFTVTDTLSNALTYDTATGVTVTAGGQAILAGTDYNANYDSGTRVVTVDFTTAGLKKIAGIGVDTKLNINVATKINNNATMGAKITNNATLSFDNGHGTKRTTTVADVDIPEVHTGGKNFIKTNGGGTNLADAQFKIKNTAGKYLIQDASTLAITWGDVNAATVFKSGSDGQFNVKGLAYGDYILEEIKAPNGYTLPTNPNTTFTVDENSYYSDTSVAATTAPTATPLEIINKERFLPDTGGAGTIIFTVIGLLLMTLAVLLLRKKNEA